MYNFIFHYLTDHQIASRCAQRKERKQLISISKNGRLNLNCQINTKLLSTFVERCSIYFIYLNDNIWWERVTFRQKICNEHWRSNEFLIRIILVKMLNRKCARCKTTPHTDKNETKRNDRGKWAMTMKKNYIQLMNINWICTLNE